jgi:hypothetical protein
MAAVLEQVFRMRRLEVIDTDLAARDVCGDRKDGHIVAVGIVQAVDQVKVSWTTASGANSELPSEVGFGASGERGTFFVPNVYPLYGFQSTQGIGEPVQRIAHNTVYSFNTGLDERIRHVVGCGPTHHSVLA